MEILTYKVPLSTYKTCEKCDAQYHVCECGISHGTGSANAEHLISYHEIMGPNTEGFFTKSTSEHYQPWEGPAPQCPFCYHKEHPEQKEAILSKFGIEAQIQILLKIKE